MSVGSCSWSTCNASGRRGKTRTKIAVAQGQAPWNTVLDLQRRRRRDPAALSFWWHRRAGGLLARAEGIMAGAVAH
eukprot:5410913-Prymnesium_polylepis.1